MLLQQPISVVQNKSQQKGEDDFLPLQITTINFLNKKECNNLDGIIISNNKNYICFFTFGYDKRYRFTIEIIKLYSLVTKQLIKQFKENTFCRSCEFSEDSTILFIRSRNIIFYHIEKNKVIQVFKEVINVKISQDSSKYMYFNEETIHITENFNEISYQNITQSTSWEFSRQQNLIISFYKNEKQLQVSYFRIKNLNFHIVSNKIHFRNSCFFNAYNFIEIFDSRLVIIFTQSNIKIFNQQGKLLKNINTTTECFLNIQIKKDCNGKQTLVCVYKPMKGLYITFDEIGFICLLTQVKIQIINLSKKDYSITKKLGQQCVLLEHKEKINAEVCYID